MPENPTNQAKLPDDNSELPLNPNPGENRAKPRKEKQRREVVFTAIPPEVEEAWLKTLLKFGFRMPDVQRRKTDLRELVAKLDYSRGNPSDVVNLFSHGIDLIYPSTRPNDRIVQLTPGEITQVLNHSLTGLVLKDPIGYLAVNIIEYAGHMKVPIPPMQYDTVERLVHLQDKRNALKLSKRRPLQG